MIMQQGASIRNGFRTVYLNASAGRYIDDLSRAKDSGRPAGELPRDRSCRAATGGALLVIRCGLLDGGARSETTAASPRSHGDGNFA